MANGKKVPVIISFEALDKISGPMKQLAQRFEATKAPIVRLQNNFSRLYKSTGIPSLVSGFTTVMGFIAKTTLALGAMGFAAYYAFQKFVGSTIEAGSKLHDLSKKTGVSVEELQKWRYAVEQSGGSADEADTAFTKFSKALSDAKRGTGDLVALLGKDSPLLNKITKKDTATAMGEFVDVLGTLPSEADAIKLGMAGLGRGAEGLITLAREGKANREELFKQAEAAGLLHRAQTDMADEVGDKFKFIGRQFQGMQNQLVAALLPSVLKISTAFSEWLTKNRETVDNLAMKFGETLPAAIEAVTKLMVKFGDAIVWINENSAGLGKIFTGLAKIIEFTFEAIMNGPIGWALKSWKFAIEATNNWKPVGAYATAPVMNATPPVPNPGAMAGGGQTQVRMVIEGAPKGTRLYTEKSSEAMDFQTFMGMKMGGSE